MSENYTSARKSEIINKKKQLIFIVDQTSDFVYPNEIYKYQVYCKNISGDIIENVRIQVYNPSTIAIEEEQLNGIEIGDLNNGESRLLYLSSRCSTPGEFIVHFLCFGEESELKTSSLKIDCSYNSASNKTIHKIHIYNFSPYEETYELMSKDYNDDFTQLIKRQKLPYKAKENPFKMYKSELNQGVMIDESQSYIDQKEILYGNGQNIGNNNLPPYNTDEHSYQYLERENFNKEAVESYEGENLLEIFNNINKYSKLFNVYTGPNGRINTGNNELLNDFKEYSPNGFIHRFGLLTSEIFHHLGVIPDFSYMNDHLFRWASNDTGYVWFLDEIRKNVPLKLYPQHEDLKWDYKRWAGQGWAVWKTYTDLYQDQIKDKPDYEPLLEYMETFDSLTTAEEYIRKEYEFDSSNEFYINDEDGITKIRKYEYVIKEIFYDNGVFFIHIPVSKIPKNFFLLDTEEIEALIEKTKPFGLKGLIKYVLDVNLNMNINFSHYTQIKPKVKFEMKEAKNKLKYCIIPYKYNNVVEKFCEMNGNTKTYRNRETFRLTPDGVGYCHQFKVQMNPKISSKIPNPKKLSKLNFNPLVTQIGYKCEDNNNLTYFNQIQDLLYRGNFDSISFKIEGIHTYSVKAPKNDVDLLPETISTVNYKLWIESLIRDDSHSYWWDLNFVQNGPIDNDYYIVDGNQLVDFIEIPVDHPNLAREGIEIGIGFKDSKNKLHGISLEYKEALNSFKIRYTTSLNNNFKVKKEGVGDIIGLAYKFSYVKSNTLVVFLLKIKNADNSISYHYFTHAIVGRIKSIFCFIRNDEDFFGIRRWSNLIRLGRRTNPAVIFNTPQYKELVSYEPTKILDAETSSWKNVYKIDDNEHSYAEIRNTGSDYMDVDDISIHFDEIKIPADAIIKSINIESIIETNTYKTIFPSIRLQDGFITNESLSNTLFLHPSSIEFYPAPNNNTKYYEEKYNVAKRNEVEKSIKLYESKISENKIFNQSIDYSISDYMDDIDDYITITKPYWIELSDFIDCDSVSMNDISEIQFYIEGYNEGEEVHLSSQLKENDILANKKDTLIPSGYFRKGVSLNFLNSFFTDTVQLRFRFRELNSELKIFNTYLRVEFKNKQNQTKDFIEQNIDIENKKNIGIELLDEEILGYLLSSGLTVKLGFDSLDLGEYYRVYSVKLNIIYQKQSSDFLINVDSPIIDNNNDITIVNGKCNNYLSGMFFNEIIMSGAYQQQESSLDDNGIKLEDALYQSFEATSDNMTSITLYPNGFVGNPDMNLKIGLYDNKVNSPNRLIKEIKVNGWSKTNSQLKNSSIISYDFNVNDLVIGKKYWIKIEVENPVEGSYYLLKYFDAPAEGLKLLRRYNNNLINTFGCLKFYVNTLNSFRSFNSLPASEDQKDFSDPKIFIGLNKNIGEVKKIKVQKMLK